METKIRFGTDGWRAIVGEDFTDENVILVSNSIAKYVYETYGIEKPILVGYDPRNKADYFSRLACDTLVKHGFNVYYSDKVVPTPVLAYCAKSRNACALMFTASHNPPEYLGIKFIPDYAGPATKEITDKLTQNLAQNFETGYKNGTVIPTDFSEEYFEHINNIIDFGLIKTLKENIIFDGLYAASIGYFDKLLTRHNIKFESLHMNHDINFGGGMPEPKPKYLKELITKVKENGNAVGCANDGDSDRFGFINENGQYVTPNEIIAILLLHLVRNKNYTGCLIKTVGASLMLDKIAQQLGLEVIETAVGFKHVGEAMRKYDCIIAGEESGGLSIKGHIPEKDGILANLLILEAMAYSKKSMVELQEELKTIVGCEFVNDRIDFKLNDNADITKVLDKIDSTESVCGMKITKKDKKDGIKLYFGQNNWILVRPSGTEPLLRIYFESDSQKSLDLIKQDILSIIK